MLGADGHRPFETGGRGATDLQTAARQRSLCRSNLFQRAFELPYSVPPVSNRGEFSQILHERTVPVREGRPNKKPPSLRVGSLPRRQRISNSPLCSNAGA